VEYNYTYCNTATDMQCPVDCVIGQWTPWSDCSVICLGPGSQVRTRPIYQIPVNGAGVANCTDPNTGVPVNWQNASSVEQYVDGCNAGVPCPQDCVQTPWNGWSSCSVECGGGSMTRARTVAIAPLYGGAPCGVASQVSSCNMLVCSTTGDCNAGPWGEWGNCAPPYGTPANETANATCYRNATRTGTNCTPEMLVMSQPCTCGVFPIGAVAGAGVGALLVLLVAGGTYYSLTGRTPPPVYGEGDIDEFDEDDDEEEDGMTESERTNLGGTPSEGVSYVDVDPDSSFWNKRVQ